MTTTETVGRLRAAQDMVRLLLGNVEREEADTVIVTFVIDSAGSVR